MNMMLEIIMMLERAVLIMMVFRMMRRNSVWSLTVVNNRTSSFDNDFCDDSFDYYAGNNDCGEHDDDDDDKCLVLDSKWSMAVRKSEGSASELEMQTSDAPYSTCHDYTQMSKSYSSCQTLRTNLIQNLTRDQKVRSHKPITI